ncbi:unnamed protein product [Ranitomeya imitator]|uniref:Reverse transcriptase domain-containing protein n=1 Tax=Ranitomeya imitator TaxID=111125 RepID=A0ABN9KTQ3_9NEOB|nr:unnamed protein product [Ranitomeya imitator]
MSQIMSGFRKEKEKAGYISVIKIHSGTNFGRWWRPGKKTDGPREARLFFKRLYHQQPSVELSPLETEAEVLQVLEELASEADASKLFPKHLLPKSKRFPQINSVPAIDFFVQLVMKDVEMIPETISRDNLNLEERRALKELKDLKEVIIKPSDKGGNIVVWSVKAYEREMMRQLKDSSCYRKLTFNPLSKFRLELFDLLELAVSNGILTSKQRDGLWNEDPTVASIYLLPKIHKDPVTPPGRPIVSGVNGLCDPISKFIDFHLKSLVETLPSFLKDTTDVLKKLDGLQLEENMALVTCDVESLYTSIRHQNGLEAVSYFLRNSDLDLDLFTGHRYGGVLCAPYANLFLGLWERDVFLTDPHPLSQGVVSWWRYIDDILMVWQGSEFELEQFIGILNSNVKNIKLTYKYKTRRI